MDSILVAWCEEQGLNVKLVESGKPIYVTSPSVELLVEMVRKDERMKTLADIEKKKRGE